MESDPRLPDRLELQEENVAMMGFDRPTEKMRLTRTATAAAAASALALGALAGLGGHRALAAGAPSGGTFGAFDHASPFVGTQFPVNWGFSVVTGGLAAGATVTLQFGRNDGSPADADHMFTLPSDFDGESIEVLAATQPAVDGMAYPLPCKDLPASQTKAFPSLVSSPTRQTITLTFDASTQFSAGNSLTFCFGSGSTSTSGPLANIGFPLAAGDYKLSYTEPGGSTDTKLTVAAQNQYVATASSLMRVKDQAGVDLSHAGMLPNAAAPGHRDTKYSLQLHGVANAGYVVKALFPAATASTSGKRPFDVDIQADSGNSSGCSTSEGPEICTDGNGDGSATIVVKGADAAYVVFVANNNSGSGEEDLYYSEISFSIAPPGKSAFNPAPGQSQSSTGSAHTTRTATLAANPFLHMRRSRYLALNQD